MHNPSLVRVRVRCVWYTSEIPCDPTLSHHHINTCFHHLLRQDDPLLVPQVGNLNCYSSIVVEAAYTV